MNKINILTWNIKNNKTDAFHFLLNEMLDFYKIDILILQESSGIDFEFRKYEEIPNLNPNNKWIRIFYKIIQPIEHDNIVIRLNNKLFFTEFVFEKKYKFSLCGVHFYSKSNEGNQREQYYDQDEKNRDIPKLILEYEKSRKHDKTILVGDFNCNPFDKFMNVNINSKSNKENINFLAEINRNKGSNFFYNPMWNLFGDYNFITNKSLPFSGTYYMKIPNSKEFFWNILDGVLLRPKMMETLELNTLKIISEFKGNKLVRENKDKDQSFILEKYSDHLPVTFTLNLKKINK